MGREEPKRSVLHSRGYRLVLKIILNEEVAYGPCEFLGGKRH